MKVRLIEFSDIEFVRSLRNEMRIKFFSSNIITKEEQIRWFENFNSDTKFYILDLDGRIGCFSIIKRDDGNEVGNVMLKKEFQGNGYMRCAIQSVLIEGEHYYAQVKPDNHESIGLFEKLGFEKLKIILEKK